MTPSIVNVYSPEGVLLKTSKIEDTEGLALRMFKAMDCDNAEAKAEQVLVDLIEECAPMIESSFNGCRCEFLTVD